MKKILLPILLLGLFANFFVFAQTGIEYKDVQLDADKISEANADLSQIEIDFCDKEEAKTIEYSIAPGKSQDLCLKATNLSSKDIEVTIGFVDGTVTNDERQNKACMQQGENEKFGQYVTGYTESFIVEANNISYQHATIQFPSTSKGIINGCLVYYTKGVEMGGQMNFTILMRKAKFIDVTIAQKNLIINKFLGIIFGIFILSLFFLTIKKTAYKK